MFFFNKPLICYLSSSFLAILTSNNTHKLSFTPELVQHSEVVDKNKFAQVLLRFLSQIGLKDGKGVIVLSPELVFSGQIGSSVQGGTDPVEQFVSSVPLARENIASITIENKNFSTVYATNRQLYGAILNAFIQNNIKIYSVVPLPAFQDIPGNLELNREAIWKKIGDAQMMTACNFLQSKSHIETSSSTDTLGLAGIGHTNKHMATQYAMLLISLLLLAGAVIYFLLWSETIQNPWVKKNQGIPPKTTVLLTSTIPPITQPTPTVKFFDKSTLKIQILNGSGIEGQAVQLSLILQDNGYMNISTGNALSRGAPASLMYSKSVSSDTLEDIVRVIKRTLPNPTLQIASASAEFDVVITTQSGE